MPTAVIATCMTTRHWATMQSMLHKTITLQILLDSPDMLRRWMEAYRAFTAWTSLSTLAPPLSNQYFPNSSSIS
jgi:hypothetical protein